MHSLEHAGWRLSYRDRGEGPVVLLIHPLLMDHRALGPQAAGLLDRYRVLTPDLRGHGASEHRVSERTLWELMEDQIALLDHLEIRSAVWGGASVAGPIALRAALRYPERVDGLVLISTQAGPEDPQRLEMYEGFANLVIYQGWTDGALRGIARTNFGPSAPPEVVEEWLGRWRSWPTDDLIQVIRSLTRRESLLDRLHEIAAPALVVYGEEDLLALRPDEVEAMAAGLPNLVELVRIPGAGHTVTLEAPELVTSALRRFLDTVCS